MGTQTVKIAGPNGENPLLVEISHDGLDGSVEVYSESSSGLIPIDGTYTRTEALAEVGLLFYIEEPEKEEDG
jgi:hypothetical protein